MVDIADRAAREAQLARRLGKANAEARRVFLAAIEDGVISDEEWRAISGAYQSVLQAELEQTSIRAGLAAAESLGIGVDPSALHARTIEWARQYSFELVSRLDATNRRLLQDTISDYFAGRLKLADVEARLVQPFGPVRAQMIATTEITRAVTAGEVAYNRELEGMGVRPVLVWRVTLDDRTCPICFPRADKVQGDGWRDPPPAHIGCRCYVDTEILEATR